MVHFSSRGYVGTGSPNRADALFWALAELFPGLVKSKKTEEELENEEPIFEANDWMG